MSGTKCCRGRLYGLVMETPDISLSLGYSLNMDPIQENQ